MANGIFLHAKGRFAEKFSLPLGTDAIEIRLLKSTVQADATLKNYADLATLLASNAEAGFLNYSPKILNAAISVTFDTTTGKATAKIPDQTWFAAGSGDELGKIITVYQATSSQLDSAKLPLTYHDFTAETTGSDLLAQIAATGLAVAA